jgi:hypothetical protein
VTRLDASSDDPLAFNVWLEVETRRSPVWTTGLSLECLACGAKIGEWGGRSVKMETFDAWATAAWDWAKRGQGLFACPECGHVLPVTEWKQGDGPWGFGNLAFWFWNYGLLKNDFVREFAHRLGHRIVVPYDKF